MSAIYSDLQGQTVLVTGGASGIGASIVEAFCRQGCKVGFLDFNEDCARDLIATLPDRDAVHFAACDLRDIEALKAAVQSVREALGPITILVNNAARDDRHAWDTVTSEYWDERLATNIKHQFFTSQAVIPDMIAANKGSIVNLGSNSWMVGQGGMVCYTTAKSAVNGLTRSLARDLGPHNIRVNTVVPGWILTERQRELWLNEESHAELMKSQCVKRELSPVDVAKIVVFISSDEASACSNQQYIVDGGWL